MLCCAVQCIVACDEEGYGLSASVGGHGKRKRRATKGVKEKSDRAKDGRRTWTDKESERLREAMVQQDGEVLFLFLGEDLTEYRTQHLQEGDLWDIYPILSYTIPLVYTVSYLVLSYNIISYLALCLKKI